MVDSAKEVIVGLLRKAGIELNGSRHCDIKVKDDRVFERVLAQGNLGLGDSYMDGWWDCDAIDELLYRLLRADVRRHLRDHWKIVVPAVLKESVMNFQSRARAFQVGELHYDLGNDLFERMLDRRLAYSCGYWKNAGNLEEAQEQKLDLTCRKLQLKPGMSVLDIGCGWGSFVKFAAERYGVTAVGVTVSKQQAEYARRSCASLPVDVRLQDYREVSGRFDAVLSIGFFEHVGLKNYRSYFEVVDRCLSDNGVSILHTMGLNRSSLGADNLWATRYIFPNGKLPSIAQIAKAAEEHFIIEDLHNFGPDYDRTYMAWQANFETGWQDLRAKYDQRFYRMWRYYLMSFAAGFRAREIELWQLAMVKTGTRQPNVRLS